MDAPRASGAPSVHRGRTILARMSAEEPEGASLTIDALAQRTGMTVRNIRAHQSRGLQPPPEVRARTGYYGEEHVARIELVKELQADGLPLDVIKRMLEHERGSAVSLLRFTRALHEPFSSEEPVVVERSALRGLFGTGDEGPRLVEKAERLGILRPLGDDRYELVSPRLGEAGAELAALGIDGEQALDLVAKLRKQADAMAKAFTDLYLQQIWKPFDKAGRPEEQWPEVLGALERLRPLATDAVVAMMGIAMAEAVEKAFGQVARGDVPSSSRKRGR